MEKKCPYIRRNVKSIYDESKSNYKIEKLKNYYIGGTFSYSINKKGAQYLLNFIKQNIEHKFPNIDYEIVLRMNCEGSEYDVIQGAKKIFGAQFSLVLGSLDDVLKYHGQDVYNQMEKFLEDNRIDFRVFNTILTSHAEALKVLVSKLH